MALSQIQCLDNNNVNWRSSETKPEFFYSEEQRLALEALVSTGQDAFGEVVKKENIRDFLSELELAKIVSRVEAFDPDSSHLRKSGDKCEQDGEGDPQEGVELEHSLEYWPDKSDCPIPELDLGWPDTVAYRGVTRATVYMQPPIDGQPHIKEVVRKMITQAQRVIAVVMDLFTDLDIFKDLLESGFKRKVSVYIILSESEVKYFLQMCEKAQMHRGHLKNLRIRSIGGTEFYTRFSTKFKGSLGQKFMFVDGDKTMCGSYSFTWSAARIDRNLITVLSGQVVESFDRQFQELYLLSKGISLKNVPMDNEPEPEPVIQPASIPTGPTESIAKKLINPKYGLVNIKSASETDKDSKKEAEIAKKLPTKPRVSAFEHQVEEHQIHPALQDMERADMFEYLPTWVEPDPEPGSDILGYINIIDPNIKNAQPSQMNRIKICDTSQATAQFLQQTREIEMMKQQQQESPSSNTNASGPPGHTQEPCPNKSVPPEESSKGQEKSRENGPSEGRTENRASQQDSQDGPLSNTRQTVSELEGGTSKQHNGEATSKVQEMPTQKRPLESIASLAANNHLVSRNTSSGPTGGNPPPVPKPRTVQVTDFITMKNTLNTKSSTLMEENTVPSVNGVDGEGRESEEIDIFIENGPNDDQDEDDTGIFGPCPGEYSSSGSGSLPPSNASSMSEEYYPSASMHRRSSERISNGERPPPHRKLSDGHISRGSFLSPLNISQTLLEVNPTENGKRRSMLEDYVLSNNPLQRKERIYALDHSQAKPHFHYSTNGPTGGFDRFHSHPATRSVGRGRAKKESLEGPGAYRQLSRKSDNPRPGYWSGKDYGSSYTGPQSQSAVPPDNVTTPFGIPYSKLSQAKHLKSKLGASSLDSRRRGHGPPGHKDL